jgi:hypothetical protein
MLVWIIDITILMIINPEATAWILKYNGAVRISFLFLDDPKIGRNENIFSSNPTQRISHWLDEIEIQIPIIIIMIRRTRVGSHIKTRSELNASKED